jgi:hypothetical protein
LCKTPSRTRAPCPASLARAKHQDSIPLTPATGPYEFIRRLVSPVGPDGKPQRTLPASIAAGGLTGICYWLSCYPIDVVKNRLQAAPDTSPPVYSGMRDVARVIYREAGVRGFFRGFVPCILRAFPANASCFVAFEMAMRWLPID